VIKGKVSGIIRMALQKFGTRSQKQNLWNKEFSAGHWDYIDRTPDDCIYRFLARYSRQGSILDLGCGSGNTGDEIAVKDYRLYTGVDISDVAIGRARQRSQAAGRDGKNEYIQFDFVHYEPERAYDLILFRESIVYVPEFRIRDMLVRYSRFLSPGGVFVVRMCDRGRYRGILEIIRYHFHVVETYMPENVSTVVVVFRPAGVS
jgi:SAM-dependent methyltransferase